MEKISSFTLEYSFLSNDHICLVHYEGLLYASVTHAFQAARSSDQSVKEKISKIHDLESMYEIAETIEDPPGWLKARGRIMEVIIRDKFRRNPVLRQRLSDTKNSLLVNSYEDATNPNNLYWGTVGERGENTIGKILMKIRSDIKNEIELDNWILVTFDLIKDDSEIPTIILHEYKNNKKLRRVALEDKSYYIIGSAVDCDLRLSHNSIDSYHAALAHEKQLGLILIDLNSVSGTFLKGTKIRKSIPAPLDQNEIIYFGDKKKYYEVEIDYEYVRRECEKKITDIDRELELLEMMQNPSKNPEAIKESLGLVKTSKIYVENLPRKSCNEKDIKELFVTLGEIVEVDISRNKQRSQAYVTFKNFKSAESATKWNGMIFHGKRLNISLEKKRKRSRSRSSSSNM
jgi:predicted NAD-dependent protein-ADP-ribosyltransferase YbiA (DUF1768 family)